MARRAFVVVAEDVVGEEELGVAAGAGAEGHEEHFRLRGKEAREVVRDDFEFHGVGDMGSLKEE